MSHGKILYFGLYYVMTGIHGLHVLIGVGIICFNLHPDARGALYRARTL